MACLSQIPGSRVSRCSRLFAPVTVKSLSKVEECSRFADTLFGLLSFASTLTYALNNNSQMRTKTHYRREGCSYLSPQRRVLLPFDICILSRTSASAASEHCPGHKATTPRIVVVEEPTHQLSCGIKTTDGASCSIKHLRVCIDT